MAKIFNGKILFANAIQPTGAQPLDDRVVVQSYSDLVDVATFGDAKYLGMIVSVVDNSKLYMLTNTDVTAEGAWKEIGASGDVDGDVTELITKVSSLESTVGDDASGLVKDVKDLKDAAKTFVTDITFEETSLVTNGVADLSDFVQKDGDKVLSTNDYTTAEKEKLAGIAAGAEVNYIKSIGENLSVTDGKLEVSIPEVEVPEYTVAKLDTAEEGYATSYQLQKDGEGIGAVINIPKDMVVSSGEVRELTEGEITDERPQGVYVVLTLANATNDTLYIPANKLVDDYTGSTFVEVGTDGKILVKYDDLKSALETDFDNTFVKLDGYVAYSDDEKTKLAGIAANAEVNVVKSVDTEGVLGLDDSGKLSADLSEYAKSGDVANTYVAKEEGKVLSTNDFTNELKTKLEGIATGAEVNVVKEVDTTGVLGLDDSGKLSADLSAYATSTALTAKLDASAKVNGVSFVNGEATLDAADVKLNAAIGKKEVDGLHADRYTTDNDIQYVLNDIDTRIDAINTTIDNVTGGGVIADITAGDGINVDKTTKTNPTVSVKVDGLSVKIDSNAKVALKTSEADKQVLEVKDDGVYVPDMRSYWEAI